MSKATTRYVCQSCGAAFPKWMGKCTTCSAWDSLAEEVASKPRSATPSSRKAVPASELTADTEVRTPTGIGEFDRVLGGGIVPGAVILLGGDPGVGKSTLLLQALAALAKQGAKTLYVSGEESAGQTAARARRVGTTTSGLYILAETDFESIERNLDELRPRVMVLDSVQTVRVSSTDSAAGTVSQLREVALRLVERAKRDNLTVFLVGHVTKDGTLAGPKVLEHLVDTVLSFEGERGHAYRTLRAQKNRFGSATEVGVFEMSGDGIQEVKSPSAFFLAERPMQAAGSVIAASCEGSRPMLVEVQALVVHGPTSRRTANGVDAGRLAMVLAVLEKKGGLSLAGLDVFVNVAGGMRIDEPALDLPVALAVASSLRNRPVAPEMVAFGELGLAGEVRGVPRASSRLQEAMAMGFRRALVPASTPASAGIDAVGVRHIEHALETM